MTDRRPMVLGLLALALSSTGCGTVNNLNRPAPWQDAKPGELQPLVFGGVRDEWWRMASWEWDTKERVGEGVAGVVFTGIDFPLTFVGDIITLPYTVAVAAGASR